MKERVNDVYIYTLSDGQGCVRYVGKTQWPWKRYRDHARRKDFEVRIMEILEKVSFRAPAGADNLAEKRWIKHFGRSSLVNRTNGGNGAWASPISEATRDKRKAVRRTPEQRAQMSITAKRLGYGKWLKGRKRGPLSVATRRKISKTLMGHSVSAERRAAISRANKGRDLGSEWRRNVGLSLKGKPSPLKGTKRPPRSAEWCKRISEAKRGKPIRKKN